MGRGEMFADLLQKFNLVLRNFITLFFFYQQIAYIYVYITGEVEEINTGFQDSVQSPSLIALAFYDGLWAYDGW